MEKKSIIFVINFNLQAWKCFFRINNLADYVEPKEYIDEMRNMGGVEIIRIISKRIILWI